MTKDDGFWLATRDKIPCASFKTRQEAIKWLKVLLNQELKDFDKQDKIDDYTYEVIIKSLEIKYYQNRKVYLGF